jgi:hypothetical protein
MGDKGSRKSQRDEILGQYAHFSYLGHVLNREGTFGLIVRGVGQMEDLLDESLKKTEKWYAVQHLARTLDDKIRLAYVLGLIDDSMFELMLALKNTRNEVAHEWNAIVDEERVRKLKTSIPKVFVTEAEELIDLVDAKRGKPRGPGVDPRWLDELLCILSNTLIVRNGKWIERGSREKRRASSNE